VATPLRFVKLELLELRVPLRFEYKHALATRSEANNLILILHTSTGHVGYGEVIPRTYLTGEDMASAWSDLRETWWPALRALEVDLDAVCAAGTVRPLLDRLAPLYAAADGTRRLAAYGGIDVAAVDAVARSTRMPGDRLFGSPRAPGPSTPRVRLTATVGASSLTKARLFAAMFRLAGFREFKVKAGDAGERDRVAGVRKLVGSGVDLHVDVNGGWSAADALERLEGLCAPGGSCVEQPLPAEELDAMAALQARSPVPLMADESLCTIGDAKRLLAHRAARLWNIRLGKVGGFSGVARLLELARSGDVGVQLGVLVGETAVLAAAGRACLGLAPWRHVEFGFSDAFLVGQPFRGAPDGYRGRGSPLGAAPGLGVQPILERIGRAVVRRDVLR
jgi:L-Ala-D/L-Glu epimerase